MNYKRMAVFAVCALILCTALSAEDFAWSECWKNYGGTVKEGDFIVNAGLGTSSFALEHQDYDAEYRLPYFEVSAEYAQKIWVLPFTFGGFFGYTRYGWKERFEEYSYACNRDFFNFGALANYHVQLPVEKLDVYSGLRLGVQIRHDNWDTKNIFGEKKDGSDTDGFCYCGYTLGASYYFTDMIGANLETGFPTFLKAGVSFKF